MEITKLQKFLETIVPQDDPQISLHGEVLGHLIEVLPTFDEFKDVKKINILPMPNYAVKKGTNIPLINDKDYLGENYDVETALTFKLADGICNLNEEIDIISISMTPAVYDPNSSNNEIGVRRINLLYNPKSFTPTEKIEIVWSKEMEQDNQVVTNSDEPLKDRLIRLFEEALDGKHNLPTKRGIMVRISPRSFKQKEVAE